MRCYPSFTTISDCWIALLELSRNLNRFKQWWDQRAVVIFTHYELVVGQSAPLEISYSPFGFI